MVKQMITPLNSQVRQTHLSRLYFLSKGCKQVPLDLTDGKVLWANPYKGIVHHVIDARLDWASCIALCGEITLRLCHPTEDN